MGFLSSIFSNENRTRTDMEKKLFVLWNEKRGWTRGADKAEKQILKEVFDIIEEVPETKKLLDDVAKEGYKFFFQQNTGKAEGACDAEHKYIMLNPTLVKNPAELAIATVHEMTHAMQHKNLGDDLDNNASGLTLADQIRLGRAKEAGANVQEASFACQILDRHPEAKDYVERCSIPMAYINEMRKSGDKSKAAEKCFREWYDYEPYQSVYEEQHIDFIVFDLDRSSKKDPVLQKSLSPEEIISKCIYSEEHKNAVLPEFLNSPEANRLTEKGKERLDIVSKNCEKYFGVKDASYTQMVSYKTGKTYAGTERPQPAKESMMSMLKKTEQAKASEKPSLMSVLAAAPKAADNVKAEALKIKQGNER